METGPVLESVLFLHCFKESNMRTPTMTYGKVAVSRLSHSPPGKVAHPPCNLLNNVSKKAWRSHMW